MDAELVNVERQSCFNKTLTSRYMTCAYEDSILKNIYVTPIETPILFTSYCDTYRIH